MLRINFHEIGSVGERVKNQGFSFWPFQKNVVDSIIQ